MRTPEPDEGKYPHHKAILDRYREVLLAYGEAFIAYENAVLCSDLRPTKAEVLGDVANMATEAFLLKMTVFQRFETEQEFDS